MDRQFLSALTHGANLQELADLAANYLEYPLVVRNYARDTLFCSKNYPMDDLEDRQNRHISLLRQTGEDNDGTLPEFLEHLRTGKPYIRMYPYLRRARMFCGCIYAGIPVGYIMLPGTDTDYSTVDRIRVEEVAGIFAAAFVLNGHPFRVEQDENTSLLWDLLQGENERPVPRLSLLHRPFNGLETFRIVWIPAREEECANALRSLFKPCWYVEMADGCAVLTDGSQSLKGASEYLVKAGYSAGISNIFERLPDAYRAWNEAQMAYEYARALGKEAALHRFSRYEMLALVSQTLKRTESGNAVCALLHRIMSYDAAYGTEYVPTLRAYLECKLDIGQAAERLKVHRNTAAYRLKKLQELFETDLNDPLDLSCIYWQILHMDGIL